MKWSFRTSKILFACLVIFCFLSSCNSPKPDADDKLILTQQDTITQLKDNLKILRLLLLQDAPPQLRGNQINITKYDIKSGNLGLADQIGSTPVDAVSVNRKQTITWHVNGVIQIDEIGFKNQNGDDPNFFVIMKPTGTNTDWSAKVRDLDSTQGAFTHYYIKWHDTRDPKKSTHKYDPLMQLNPIN